MSKDPGATMRLLGSAPSARASAWRWSPSPPHRRGHRRAHRRRRPAQHARARHLRRDLAGGARPHAHPRLRHRFAVGPAGSPHPPHRRRLRGPLRPAGRHPHVHPGVPGRTRSCWRRGPSSTPTSSGRTCRRRTQAETRRRRLEGDPQILVVRDLDVGYDSTQVLFGVDLEVADGEIVALLGTNGAASRRCCSAISGLQRSTAGAIIFDGRDVSGADAVRDGGARHQPRCPASGHLPEPHRRRRTCAWPAGSTARTRPTWRPPPRRCSTTSPCCAALAPAGRQPLRRRAADAGRCAGLHRQAQAAHDRRALAGPRPHRGRPSCSPSSPPSRSRARPSSSSSSPSTPRCRRPTGPCSWRRARCGSPARPPSCSSGRTSSAPSSSTAPPPPSRATATGARRRRRRRRAEASRRRPSRCSRSPA